MKTNSKQKLTPKCFNGKLGAAVTNKGYLIPCCYCDTRSNLSSPEMKKLEKVSKIDSVDSIEEIFLTNEWQEFASNLENDKGPPSCWRHCGDTKNKTKRQTTFYKSKKIKKEEV